MQEVTRANQVVLPMLNLDSLVVASGGILCAPLHVANDGPPLPDVTVEARFGDTAPTLSVEELLLLDGHDLPPDLVAARFRETVAVVDLGTVAGWSATAHREIEVDAPAIPGSHDLVLRLLSGGELVAENRYPVHVVEPVRTPVPVRILGSGRTAAALVASGASPGGEGPTVVPEDALDDVTGVEVRGRLADGEVVVILAQAEQAAPHYPVPVELDALTTLWGSTIFKFTTEHGAIPSLPRRAVLVAEDSTVESASVLSTVDGRPFPETPVVIAYKPVPGALTGTLLGSHPVGPGRLVFCQYRLTDRAAAGDAAACGVLGDVLRWAARPRPVMTREGLTKDDGRTLVSYSWREDVAR